MNLLTLKDEPGFFMMMSENTNMIKGRLMIKEPMSRHTSWRVGGPADRLYIPRNFEDLKQFLGQLEDNESLTWVGLGSNLLVRDGGIRGTVIATKNMDQVIELGANNQLFVGAGCSCAQLAKTSVKLGLTGAEFLIGVPGTFGGALAMNAGAFGFETWDKIHSATTINRKGIEITRGKKDFSIGYRSVSIPQDEWFISAVLSLGPDAQGEGKNKIKDLLNRRSDSQPIGEASCGSVFKNPDDGAPAAKLIDSCGLKGLAIGGAVVSDKHANFIINRGNATANDIENLILKIQKVVFEKYKINLIPEVKVIGDDSLGGVGLDA